MAIVTKEDLDWFRSPEAASKGVDEEEIRVLEDLWARKEALVAGIRSVFGSVRLGEGVGLLESDARDMCVDLEKPKAARKRDERDSWECLSDSDLAWCRSALSFTDAEGYRFLLPAFMVAELNSEIDVWTLIRLSNTRDDEYETLALLNEAQLKTIIEFLELFLDDPYSEFHHKDIREALNVYWKPQLESASRTRRG